uniref:Structural maintenance of chromosomes protein 6 n=1 Tax=Scophthalmus maximus TaxID=52904 RepID=A0A8D3BY77_SCOMX
MSKRKSSSVSENVNKRVRPEQEEDGEEEEDENAVDSAGEVVSDAGIVESITLKNFMCHSLLGPFTFGSNVNFVVGNNGSGKSAVLTALIVALGGNAQATNRGSSLKGFVKEGESSADVSITLRNKGRDAYKPEVYGQAIIVDLRITREGLRTYKLRSKSGQIVSTKKEELISILDNFNIQVNNPVSILTQEMSKYFLHSKGEGDKYKFFMKATQLEQMREDFVYIRTTKHVTEDKVEQQNECLKDLRQRYKEKEERYKSLASLDEMHTKLAELQKQMAWALVAEMEKELEPMKEKLHIHNKIKASNITKWAPPSIFRREQEVLQRSIDSNRRNLQTLESSRSNRLRRFGEHMPALLSAIQEAHRRGQFKHKPLGPLGKTCFLKDPELALAVEVCLKGQLQAFTCDNYEDEKVLQGLMARVFTGGRRPTIITSQFLPRLHDTRKKAVNHPEYPSVLQALEIEDSVVANCLIDQRGIESILLIKNRTVARRLMHGKNPPQNCFQAFSIEGDQIFTNRAYSADQTRANYLSGDVEEEIRHLQKELENQEAQATRFQQQMKRLDEDIRQNEGLLRRAYTDQKTEEELQEIVAKISSKRAEFDQARAQMTDLKASYEEAEQAYKQQKEQINTIAEDADPIKEDLNKAEQEMIKCKHHKKHYDDKRSTHLRNIQSLEADLGSKEQELQTSVSKATEICPERLEVRRSARSMDSEINRLKVKISTQQEQQGDREEVVKQYQEALETYKNLTQQMKNLNSFIKSLDSVMNHRLQVYAELRRFLSARCKYYFDSMLAQRGYTGNMAFDHKNETLSISVQPGQGNKADLSDMRSLSGGERSFSTVCFVLSLWAITEAPFRCLDEFDVYMDMVNRRISMDMMLKVAAGQRYRQFIFLTPQSMGTLPVSKIIRILRLKDPDRGQNNAPTNQDEDQ